MKVLCTFSGKFGDILWSLPTVREISRQHGGAVDFAIMPQYHRLLPLLNAQSYIAEAKIIPEWACWGSPYGDQPWEPPKAFEAGYEGVYHLTYRQHPGMGCPKIPLVDFTAWQQHINLGRPVIPFIEVQDLQVHPPPALPVLCYGFNGNFHAVKQQFLGRLIMRTSSQFAWTDTSTLSWQEAGSLIRHNFVFVGCRSAQWVLAMAVGAQTITYEPDGSRHAEGPWGPVFGCPHGKEFALPLHETPHSAADRAADAVLAWRDQYWKKERKGERVIA